MLKTFSVKNIDISDSLRFEPRYYYYSKVLKKKSLQKGIKFTELAKISDFISDGEHSHIKREKERGVRYLYGRNIKEGLINYDPISDSPFISEDDYGKFKRTHINQDDILLTIVGTVGKSALYKEEYVGKAGIPRHIAKIRLNRDANITPEFITAFFRSKIGKWQLSSIITGNIQPLLSIKNIKTLDIPIANNSLITRVTNLEKKAVSNEIKALLLLQKAQKLFYEKLDIDFSKIKKKNSYSVNLKDFKDYDIWTPKFSYPYFSRIITAFRKRWKVVQLGKVADFKKGNEVGSINYNEYIDKKEGDVPFIRTSDIVNFDTDSYPDFYIPKEIFEEIKQDVRENDILFTKDGKIGVTSIVTKADIIIISSGLLRIRLNNIAKSYGLTPEYLFMVLSTKETGLFPALRRTVIASTIPHLREDRIKDIEIPILSDKAVKEITNLVKKSFILKSEKKLLFENVREEIDNYFKV